MEDITHEQPVWRAAPGSLPANLRRVYPHVPAHSQALFDAGMILLAGFLTPYQIGRVLGYLLASAILTTIAAGLWMLARYVRTSRFRKQPAPVANPLP